MIGKYKDLEFWAEDGNVVLFDKSEADKNSDKAYCTISPSEFMKRAIAVACLYKDVKPEENFKSRQLLEAAEIVCRTAKEQAAFKPKLVTSLPTKPVLSGINYKFKYKSEKEILKNGYEYEVS